MGKDKEKDILYWLPSKEGREVYKEPKVGDILLTTHALPHGGILFWKDFNKKEGYQISIRNLRDYLKLLELIILNERVIVGAFPGFEESITADEYDNEDVKNAMGDYTDWYRLVPTLDLKKDLRNRVKNSGIFVEAVVYDKTLLLPDELVKRYIKVDEGLKALFENHCEDIRKGYKIKDELAERVALSVLFTNYGGPLYISEFCRLAGIPYWLSEHEEKILRNQINMENTTKSQVVGAIKEKLDIGARDYLEKLEKFGVTTIFPETPIASNIIQEANKPEDINKVALQMREEFKKLRNYMNEMQEEMLKEETSVDKKIKIYKEIEMLCNEIWPKKGEGWKTIFNSISGFLNVAIEGSIMPSVGTTKGIVEYLVNQPYELLIRAMKRRKLRVLLEAEKNFLRSNNWSDKIAKIFGLTSEEVRQAQVEELTK